VTTRLQHALEVSDGSATLYLSGTLAASDAFPLRGVCIEIPSRVSTLRLDLHAVTRVEEGAMDAVRAVVRYWRESRQGAFRLSVATPHVVATITENPGATTRVQAEELPLVQFGGRAAALTGMYL
jgi:ABC-type transporter Mla MlaB component